MTASAAHLIWLLLLLLLLLLPPLPALLLLLSLLSLSGTSVCTTMNSTGPVENQTGHLSMMQTTNNKGCCHASQRRLHVLPGVQLPPLNEMPEQHSGDCTFRNDYQEDMKVGTGSVHAE